MESRKDKADKCRVCYWITGCMLTLAMAKDCGGPFKNEASRRTFIQELFKKK